jgi:hypothetical protein
MVFVNGARLEQKFRRNEAIGQPGSFYVDEDRDRIHMNLPSGVSLPDALIEVSTRFHNFRLQNLDHLTLDGMTFQHANPFLDRAAVEIVDQNDITIRNCLIQQSSWNGISFYNIAEGLIVERTTSSHNGGDGMKGERLRDGAVLTENVTNYNNWRGGVSGVDFWGPGQKFLRTRNLRVNDHTSIGNLSPGFWLDTDNEGAVIDGLTSCDNLRGIFIEANQGPIELKNSLLCRNQKDGILISSTHRLTLQGNVVRGNQRGIAVSGDEDRSETNFVTGESMLLNAEAWNWYGNTVVSPGGGQDLIYLSGHLSGSYYDRLFGDFSLDHNQYASPDSRVFRMKNGSRIDFEDWQAFTGPGREENSTFGEVQTVDVPAAPLLLP